MNEEEKRKILAEIVEMSQIYPDKEDDEITIQEYMDAAGLSRSQSVVQLDKLVERGKLTTRLVMSDGRVT